MNTALKIAPVFDADALYDVFLKYSASTGIYVTIESLQRLSGLGRYDIIELIWQLEDSGAIICKETHGDGLVIHIWRN